MNATLTKHYVVIFKIVYTRKGATSDTGTTEIEGYDFIEGEEIGKQIAQSIDKDYNKIINKYKSVGVIKELTTTFYTL